MKTRVAVAGCTGKMGQMLIQTILEQSDMLLTGALESENHAAIGSSSLLGMGLPRDLKVSSDVEQVVMNADVLIDFTRPEGTRLHLIACQKTRTALVIGTTGLTEEDHRLLREGSVHIPVFWAPNMSVGVHVVLALLKSATQMLGEGFDVEIVEAHHRHKVDAPSGTALRMGEVIAQAKGLDLNKVGCYDRHGVIGPRTNQEIGFATIRGGDVIGDHTVNFLGIGERVEITHKASSRQTFAVGAIRASRFLAKQPPGLYGMSDVLRTEHKIDGA